jgi:hypothetical protein
MTMHIGRIQLVHFAIGKQASKHLQARLIPGQQQQTGGVAIKTMHEPELRPNSLNPGDQGIALGVAKTGLTEQPGRLVHNQKMRMPETN